MRLNDKQGKTFTLKGPWENLEKTNREHAMHMRSDTQGCLIEWR
jgi:hypothetical protein